MNWFSLIPNASHVFALDPGETLTASAEGHVHMLDIPVLIGRNTSQRSITRRLRAFRCSHTVHVRMLTLVWHDGGFTPLEGKPVEGPVIPVELLGRWIACLLHRTRLSVREKCEAFAKFGLRPPDTLSEPVEVHVLDTFVRSCPFVVERQHVIGRFRCDAFIPRLNLVIEIDENGHRGYDVQNERAYEELLRANKYALIRHNPDVSTVEALIKTVWELSIKF